MSDSHQLKKRKRDLPDDSNAEKRRRIKVKSATNATTMPSSSSQKERDVTQQNPNIQNAGTEPDGSCASSKLKSKRRKLVPPRPFPTVARSASATGPRSAHKEGKNMICITRKTPLGAYMRRCRDIIIKDGYKTLHLSAMGAAIPHLLRLVFALPPILPFPSDEIHTTTTTGTAEVQDEIIPDDDDEDITYETRAKSTLLVVMKIGDGEPEGESSGTTKNVAKSKHEPRRSSNKKSAPNRTGQLVFQEPEQ